MGPSRAALHFCVVNINVQSNGSGVVWQFAFTSQQLCSAVPFYIIWYVFYCDTHCSSDYVLWISVWVFVYLCTHLYICSYTIQCTATLPVTVFSIVTQEGNQRPHRKRKRKRKKELLLRQRTNSLKKIEKKRRKNCQFCPGHNHWPSISLFEFLNLSGIVNFVIKVTSWYVLDS